MTSMRILLYDPEEGHTEWIRLLAAELPSAVMQPWYENDSLPADYLIVRKPPANVLARRPGVKAVFYIGAGIDWLLRLRSEQHLPVLDDARLVRLDDAGMGEQMVDYVVHAVLHFYRRFHDYDAQQHCRKWTALSILPKSLFPIGIMGAGVLGKQIATRLHEFGFPVRTWSSAVKRDVRYQSFAGLDSLATFADKLKIVVNVLPLTPMTRGILNRDLFRALDDRAYLVNVARGAHLNESDLLIAIREGKIDAAQLDVVGTEPLPSHHPFWNEPKIRLTPHIAADIDRTKAAKQIASKIALIENNQPINGVVDWTRGY